MSKKSEKEFFDNSYSEDTRASIGQIYSIIKGRNRAYEKIIFSGIETLKVLEYGCGTGSHSLEMARRGGKVVGIDISEVGVENARSKAAAGGLTNAEYLVMDGENMTFPDDTFDMVIGEGILHHLDLKKSYSEIARVLRPNGKAVFMEPLGHNPAIWLFRNLTPRLRTEDEHPLVKKDLSLAGDYFYKTKFEYFHLTSFASLIFLKTSKFFKIVDVLDSLDSKLIKAVPPMGLLAWYAIMILDNPKKMGQK